MTSARGSRQPLRSPGWAPPTDVVGRVVTDGTLPTGPRQRTIVYEVPFDRCDREKDYEVVRAEFEGRFGEG